KTSTSRPLPASQSWNVRRTGSSSSTIRMVSAMSLHHGKVHFPGGLEVTVHQVGRRLQGQRIGILAQRPGLLGFGEGIVPVGAADGLAGRGEMIGALHLDGE